jgi:hypothetical protein
MFNGYAEMATTDPSVRYISGYNNSGTGNWEVLRMKVVVDGLHAHWELDTIVLGQPYDMEGGDGEQPVPLTEGRARAIAMILNAPEELA